MNSTLETTRQERALIRWQSDSRMASMIATEKDILLVLEMAATLTDARSHWQDYEKLKYAASHFVGWDARNPHLRTSQAYELMITAIDELLPDSYEQKLIGDEHGREGSKEREEKAA